MFTRRVVSAVLPPPAAPGFVPRAAPVLPRPRSAARAAVPAIARASAAAPAPGRSHEFACGSAGSTAPTAAACCFGFAPATLLRSPLGGPFPALQFVFPGQVVLFAESYSIRRSGSRYSMVLPRVTNHESRVTRSHLINSLAVSELPSFQGFRPTQNYL